MARKKKKNDRTLIALLLAVALAAYLYNAGYLSGGGPSGGSTGGTPPTGDNGGCTCADPFAYIYKLPGGECQCLSCPQANPNILIKTDSICCTANTCGGAPQ